MDYPAIRDRVREDDQAKWDVTMAAEDIAFHKGRMTFPRHDRADYPDGLQLTPWATQQLCQRLHIPLAYFRRCPSVLQDMQVNHWLHTSETHLTGRQRRPSSEPEPWLLRARGDKLRGVLSARYVRLDNADLLTALEPLWESRFEVGWFALTDEAFHLRLYDSRLTREVLPNDRLMAGLHIANSEVGKRSVTVDALVFRLVCSNGLVRLVKGKSLLQQRHRALSQAEFTLVLRDTLREALMNGAGFLERLSWATQQYVRDMDHVLATLADQWRLSQTTQEVVRKAILCERGGQQESLYGLVNGLTFAAQKLTAEERYTLEVMAGRLLESGWPLKERRVLPVAADKKERASSLFDEEEIARPIRR